MLIPADQFNNQKILEIYKAAYIDAQMDDDGDVCATVDGIKFIARTLDDRPFFVISALFGSRPDATREQLLEFANRINYETILVRCCIPNLSPPAVYFDHYTMTAGGITGEEVIRVSQRFVKVIQDTSSLDTDNLLE